MTNPVKAKKLVFHDPAKAVKGGQFKGGVDVTTAMRATVRAPFAGKIPHVYLDKTCCDGPKTPAPAGSFQFSLSEEAMVPKGHSGEPTRTLTGRRAFFARIVPSPGLGRHVQEGDVLGTVFEDSLHVNANKDGMLEGMGY